MPHENGSSQPRILLVDDVPNNLKSLRDVLEPEGYSISVAANGQTALRIAQATRPDLILLDIMMPDMNGYDVCHHLKQHPATAAIPVIFITAERHETENIVQGFRVGGVDYVTKPFAKEEVLARVATHLKNAQLTKALIEKNAALEAEIARREQAETARDTAENALMRADETLSLLSRNEAQRWGIEGFIGKSQTIGRVLRDIRQLQDTGTTSVLIMGESGTGKELIARAIHFGGKRRGGRFMPLNCAAIPAELVESTLFGHVKGAFTGASEARKGYFELASGGTLFLDEIGDMPFALQAKLLRVLEDGHFMPVGGTEQRQTDVRVVAATNANLQEKIKAGGFRSDLYFRLARFTVHVPPLRERREDIPLLAQHFLRMFAAEMGVERPAISQSALDALCEYDFPGNIRELKNIIEHALISSARKEIQPEHLHFMEPPSGEGAGRRVSEGARERGSELGACAFNSEIRNPTEATETAFAERSAVTAALSSATYGCRREAQNGFYARRSEIGTSAIRNPKSGHSPAADPGGVEAFLNECCERHPDAEAHKPELLDRYLQFCQARGQTTLPRNKFYRRLQELCPDAQSALIGEKRLAGFKGLMLKSPQFETRTDTKSQSTGY